MTRLYLKKECPFCLKFRIFIAEAGITDQFEIVAFHDGDAQHKAMRARMEAAGQEPSFPAVEQGEGKPLLTGTDELIAKYAKGAGVDSAQLPLLAYYSDGVFRRYGEMFKELKALKGK